MKNIYAHVSNQLYFNFNSVYIIKMGVISLEQSSSEAEKTLKQALSYVGDSGTYQKRAIAIFCLTWVTITYATMINSFVFMNPVFSCGQEFESEVVACQNVSKCSILNDYTASYYARLYCEDSLARSLVQSSYSIGSLIGAFFFSLLSDFKGRKFSYLTACATGAIGTYLLFAGIYYDVMLYTILGQLGNGVFSSSVSTLSYIITGQIGSSVLRQRSIMMYCAVWGATQLTFVLIENHFSNWKGYLLALNLLPLLILFFSGYFFLIETPNFWFINKRNVAKCQISLVQMGKVNGKSNEEIEKARQAMLKFQDNSALLNVKNQQSVLNLLDQIFVNPENTKKIICLSFISMGFNTFYYGLLSSLERTGFSFGFNVFLIGIQQFLGYVVIGMFITKIKRVTGLFIVNTLVSVLGLTFVLPDTIITPTIQSVVISLCTLGFVSTYSLTQMLSMESFDSKIRSTAVGVCATVSQIGRFFIPFVLTAMNDIGANPIIAVSLLFTAMTIPPLFFLKETYFPKKVYKDYLKKYKKV